MSMKVIVWGTGNVGRPAIRAVLNHPGLELVAVIVANPDALFAPALANQADPLAGWLEWPGLKAVKQDALFLLPADNISRATPRLLDALELACQFLDRLRVPENNE